MGLTWSHVFSRIPINQILVESLSYKVLHTELKTWGTELDKLYALTSTKLFQQSTVIDEPIETEPVDSAVESSIDRTVLTTTNILYFTNLERTKRGLRPIKWNAKLTRSANAKSRDMFINQYFAHKSPIDPKKDFAYFIDNELYEFVRVSENLAMGEFSTSQEVVNAWMQSPTHRENILFPDYEHIGVSVQSGTMKGQPLAMIVQHFGISRKACPPISQTTQETLQTIESQAQAFKQTAAQLDKKINDPSLKLSEKELDDLIATYNVTIRNYNALAIEFKQLSDTYNKAVALYDSCIKKLN